MSQQPYGSGQPGQPQQPGQPHPGQPQQPGPPPGYPQGGYPQPGPPPSPQYGGYQTPGSPQPPSSTSSHRGNPLEHPETLAPILMILGYVVAVIGVVGGFFAFAIDGYPGSFKFVTFAATAVAGLGFGGVLIALAALLKTRST